MAEPSTAERLAVALEEAHAPAWIIENARGGVYDEFRGPLAFPLLTLERDLKIAIMANPARKRLIARVRDGEFDASEEEAKAWARSPEGREAFASLMRDTRDPGPENPV